MDEPKISIILLNWNGWKDTIECLESLYGMDYVHHEIFIVDNNSSDGSVDKIRGWAEGRIEVESKYIEYNRKNKPIRYFEFYEEDLNSGDFLAERRRFNKTDDNINLFIIKNKINYGFAEWNNIVIRQLVKEDISKYILLINNDTIVDKRCLNELVQSSSLHRDCGIMGGIIYNYFAGRIDFAGGRINWCMGNPYHLKAFKGPETAFITGCLMLIPLDVLKKVKGFDRRYFCYFEDADLCERIKSLGKKLYISDTAFIYHKIKQSTSRNSESYIYYLARNRVLFNKQYNRNILKYACFLFFQYPIKTVIAFFYFDKNGFRAWLRGILGLEL